MKEGCAKIVGKDKLFMKVSRKSSRKGRFLFTTDKVKT
jgi:hypothetical protein